MFGALAMEEEEEHELDLSAPVPRPVVPRRAQTPETGLSWAAMAKKSSEEEPVAPGGNRFGGPRTRTSRSWASDSESDED